MEQNHKNKIKKTLRILSYKQIKKETVFELPKKTETKPKTGAKAPVAKQPMERIERYEGEGNV